MSCSRRDFFSRLVAVCLSVLGLRARQAEAACVLPGPARATTAPAAAFSRLAPRTVSYLDGSGRLLYSYTELFATDEPLPGEPGDPGDANGSSVVGEVFSYHCDSVTGTLIDPRDRNDA